MTCDLISLVFKIEYLNWDAGDEMHGVISLISACFDFVVSLGEWGKWKGAFTERNSENFCKCSWAVLTYFSADS